MHSHPTRRPRLRAAIPVATLFLAAAGYGVFTTNLGLVGTLHAPQAEHVSQQELLDLVRAGQPGAAFEAAFAGGDELFEIAFNALDGVGAYVDKSARFSHVPRADLTGPYEWASHTPKRVTGPNGQACVQCHNEPFDDGAGGTASNVHRDPLYTARLDRFITRNTPHLFALGALQRLAEEMTEVLDAQRTQAVAQAQQIGQPVSVALVAKGVSFGVLRAIPVGGGQVDVDTTGVEGVNPDLIVRPFQWKGSVKTLREFNRDAAHNELGMQPAEICGDGVDGDGDGVADEMTVGDLTAMTVYLAAQPRPVSKLELAELGLLELSQAERQAITRGQAQFRQIGCAVCHVPELTLDVPVFSEPSQSPFYREQVFPGGQSTVASGVTPQAPVLFDLTRDQPDNRVTVNGQLVRLGALQVVRGVAVVRAYGDLKRHAMGAELAEAIADDGVPPDTFMTENLWGVGSTAPYLHDGRATTLTEAILAHGGEAQAANDAFAALPTSAQQDLLAFLDNLVLFKIGEPAEAAAQAVTRANGARALPGN